MQVSEVSNEDAMQLACVIKALGVATFPSVSGKDIDAVYLAKRWLFELAQKVASGLPKKVPVPSAPPASSTQGMKVKAMGPIGSSPKRKKK